MSADFTWAAIDGRYSSALEVRCLPRRSLAEAGWPLDVSPLNEDRHPHAVP